MLIGDLIRVLVHPSTGYDDRVVSRSRGTAAALVVGAGLVAAGLSALSTWLEPSSLADSAAGYGFSIVLPILFAGFWVIDATIVDAVAQLMAAPTRLRTWTVASAHAIPLLCLFEAVRVLQALIDRTGAVDVSTGVGFAEFAVIAWFIWVIAAGVSTVYDLPRFSAVSAALAPPAAVMTLLLVLLIAASALHVAGVG
jgi:Yip1-like protein